MFARGVPQGTAKLTNGERRPRKRPLASQSRRDVRAASAKADPPSGRSEAEES
ncbi:hypothetical protein GCM10009780_51250 [Actinomadura alba]